MSKAKEIDKIAKDVLGIETLTVQGRDSLDFHDLNVVLLREALEAAYDAGRRNKSFRHVQRTFEEA